MEPHTPAEMAVELARKQRHSFLNHLQVISGWLQLGQPDRARAYLDEVAARMAAEGDVVRSLPPAVSLHVLELSLEAERYAVQLDWQVEPGAESAPAEILTASRETVSRALADGAAEAAAVRRMAVRIGPGGFGVHTPPGEGER